MKLYRLKTELPGKHCITLLREESVCMRNLLLVLLLSSSFLLAQDNNPGTSSQQNAKGSKGEITVQGCVDRSRGSYVLIKQDPGMTYGLRATRKIKLGQYLGQQVEVTGQESPYMPNSSDALGRQGTPASVTLTITAIKTISKQCSAYQVSNK